MKHNKAVTSSSNAGVTDSRTRPNVTCYFHSALERFEVLRYSMSLLNTLAQKHTLLGGNFSYPPMSCLFPSPQLVAPDNCLILPEVSSCQKGVFLPTFTK